MRSSTVGRWLSSMVLLIFAGCAGQEFSPKGGMLYHPKELAESLRAVKAARAAGKDRQCPDAFRAVEQQVDNAFATYWSCRTAEAIAMAKDASAKAAALCPVAAVAPTVSITANPAAIQQGKCTTLNWTSANASSATIDQGLGGVAVSGTREVCPPATTVYTIAASGAGGSAKASTTVSVAAPPPPPPAPTVSITANPASIERGKCTTLNWTSANASSATIDQGVGGVAVSGTREVCPTASTPYTIAATGAGGSATASTTVAVTAPPPPPPAPPERLTLHINFDFDKADIRSADLPELQKALDFVKRHPGQTISIEGHTDGRGSVAYNQRLSERRAAAVKDWLVKNGAPDPGRLRTAGFGKSRPVADNTTDAGRFQNRRVELTAGP